MPKRKKKGRGLGTKLSKADLSARIQTVSAVFSAAMAWRIVKRDAFELKKAGETAGVKWAKVTGLTTQADSLLSTVAHLKTSADEVAEMLVSAWWPWTVFRLAEEILTHCKWLLGKVPSALGGSVTHALNETARIQTELRGVTLRRFTRAELIDAVGASAKTDVGITMVRVITDASFKWSDGAFVIRPSSPDDFHGAPRRWPYGEGADRAVS